MATCGCKQHPATHFVEVHTGQTPHGRISDEGWTMPLCDDCYRKELAQEALRYGKGENRRGGLLNGQG